jgi:ribose transport system substrate-binding protein
MLSVLLISSAVSVCFAASATGDKNELGFFTDTPDQLPKGKWKIALSNSLIGNAWRSQMVNTFDAYAKTLKENGVIAEYYSSSSGQDPEAQINEIRNMISQGYDAIIVDAASSTALAPICEEAVDRGIVVITFDNHVESNIVNILTTDQADMGAKQAEWLVKQMGGKGNILWIAGVEGTTTTTQREKGSMSVLKPYIDKGDIKILARDFGKWDEASVSVVINNMLSAYKDQGINGILNEAQGEVAIYNALKEHNLDPSQTPYTGEGMNCVARLIVEENCNIFSLTSPPSHAAEALRVAVKILNGAKVPQRIVTPVPSMDKSNAASLYMKGESDSIILPWTDEGNTYQIKFEDIVPKTN